MTRPAPAVAARGPRVLRGGVLSVTRSPAPAARVLPQTLLAGVQAAEQGPRGFLAPPPPPLQGRPLSLLALRPPLLQGAMSSPPPPPAGLVQKLFGYIDHHQDEFVQTLKEWVAIESDSVRPVPRLRRELLRMTALAAAALRRLGARVDLVDVGSQQLPDGQTLPMPPVILAELGDEPRKPTVCFYGHLDVQPAAQADGWLTAPFQLTEVDGKLYGRGATDNKGPVLAWIHAVSAFRALEEDLPVNVKFVLEGMEEAGSVGLEDLVRREKDGFFARVDCIVISDNLWLSQRPALVYGTRGNSYFTVEVRCRDQDFHSGTFGGILHEPMADLVALLGSLTDASGRILVPGIYDHVAPVTEEERELHAAADLDLAEFRRSAQVERFLFDTKTKPPASGPLCERQHCRLSAAVSPPPVAQVTKYLTEKFAELHSPNKCKVYLNHGGKPWVSDFNHPHYLAGRRALKTVFGVEPDLTREGGSIPVTLTFQEATGKNVMLLPMGSADDGAHSQNEKLNRYNYIEGTKMMAAYLHEVSQLKD
ncbi:beta-Ala-His dipeptidase-like [Phyllostomus discolor]|uniref:Beta-Ala-His dipeptidase-like n=1 Tax=Phyllostomus discolor TaxID=89673 RepID=A0A7E6CGM0_9CHIR|nr:beta-Ala-His dipeptidase-like [Phyllostomus discolor]